MKTVFKYEISAGPMEMPKGSQVLSFQDQRGTLCLWALVDPEAPTQTRQFQVIGTGHEVDPNSSFIGTTQVGPFVWHLFEVK